MLLIGLVLQEEKNQLVTAQVQGTGPYLKEKVLGLRPLVDSESTRFLYRLFTAQSSNDRDGRPTAHALPGRPAAGGRGVGVDAMDHLAWA